MEEKADEKKAMRKTVNFDEEALEVIAAYRKGCKVIPSFTDAVNTIIHACPVTEINQKER